MGYSRSDETKKDRFAGKFRSGKRMVEEHQKEDLTDKSLTGGLKQPREFPEAEDEDSYEVRRVGGNDIQLDDGELAVTYDAIESRASGTVVAVTEDGQETAIDYSADEVGRIVPIRIVEVKMSETDVSETDIVLYKS